VSGKFDYLLERAHAKTFTRNMRNDAPEGEQDASRVPPFHLLFQEHLERGTRADRPFRDSHRRRWKHEDFAGQVKRSPRTVTNWKNGSQTPERADFDRICALLFGDDPLHAEARARFSKAWQTADGQRGARKAGEPPSMLPMAPTEPIPAPQSGPHLGIGADLRIQSLSPPELDAAGNNLRRIHDLLPLAREAVDDIAGCISPNDNAFPALGRALARYQSAIAGDEASISWSVVWGLGVRLEEMAAAAERQIDRLAPALEDREQAAMQAWRTLHTPLILATAEGRELQDQADTLRMTREEQAALRKDAVAVASALRSADDIIEQETADIVSEAADAIGAGRHPERGTVFGIATIKNTVIVMVGAAVAAMPAILAGADGTPLTMAAWETVKNTPFYSAALKALGAGMHQIIGRGGDEAKRIVQRLVPFRSFVYDNQAPLRRIAGNTQQLRWLTGYVDFIVSTDGRPGRSDGATQAPPGLLGPAKPDWADSIGRDQYGVFVTIRVPARRGKPVTQRLRWIPPGRFTMGSPADEPGRSDREGPVHEVTIGAGFWLFDTPCAQALWEAVMGENPSYFKSADRPVETVSCDDVQSFLTRINTAMPGLELSLPSEAQWEYACRAGTRDATYAGPMVILGANNAPVLDAIAWYGGNSGRGFDLKNGFDSSKFPGKQYPHERAGTRPVALKAPNPWGLYDMLGNVREWCLDHWRGSYEGAPGDGSAWLDAGPGSAALRVIRGGSWYDFARDVRAACRSGGGPAERFDFLGFRCARVQG
jgi:formylglycine-generating enzyme required for sulfatase activity